ncbi:DUF1648 domain-containing protein [Candidatus Formimonas warabiya]|uniref:DUF1648 domain-containing protein n=1 Tax=Formimonas warabiya TaxID=1761012 RepID=A0A3G1KMU4_FORW1|nr:DUF5808 domain-containing protein [Candidatus Formimonas warabiya]ATW23773.1 hypothetical protein DCMF_02260 [Candidatus Formimonas warabiya]
MKELFIRYGVIYVLLAAFLAARPWLSRKNVLFGVVFGDTEIWKQETARKVIRRFVSACSALAVFLAGAFWLVYNDTPLNEINLTHLYSATVLALILLGMVPYILANSSMKKLKAMLQNENLVKNKITVEIGGTNRKNNEPVSIGWFLLLLVPIAVTVILAALYYPGMPEKIATHFNRSGVEDAWGVKSLSLIMGPIFNQIVCAALMFFIGILARSAPASVKGNPGAAPGYAAFRRFVSFIIIAVTLVIETKFLLTELVYLGVVRNMQAGTSVITVLIALLVIVLFAVFFRMARYQKPSGAVLDDDDKWVLGRIYFNPADPSLFVEKRSGIGRTVNFGRPAAWIILAALILFIVFKTLWNK